MLETIVGKRDWGKKGNERSDDDERGDYAAKRVKHGRREQYN